MSGAPSAAGGDGVRLAIRVTPRAKRSGLAGVVEDCGGKSAPAVRLSAPPLEGAGNAALVRLLAATLCIPRSSVRIVAGGTSRLEIVRISNLAPDVFARRLAAALAA